MTMLSMSSVIVISVGMIILLQGCSSSSQSVRNETLPRHQATHRESRQSYHPSGQDFYPIRCRGNVIDVGNPLQQITAHLEAQAIPYNSIPLSDCSGMFHRVLLMLDSTCPGNNFPTYRQQRSTRQLAEWYHHRGNLVLVHDAMASSYLIKPGAVMFFGKRGKRYADFNANDLFTRSRGIEHMGVVISVQEDKRGRVVSYRMFHGRKSGNIAKATTHLRHYHSKSYPAYGNGSQQWVAVARIVN
ncbi:MAG: hypothetical protein GTN46_12490 [Gammaproteobacteria bacterium]|nr:hypothetical protein [Gammaproteobacteria bacterium]NIN62947.1 hypothetical protein [Gammaproteobacteria bacterium]NIO63928.1 hypothetical protein [Gammaproteobacteria bacterium]NIT06776.1 hypothetical protein [Gammaproteobacteria bacterium]NIT42271.1 hypothetical protein [Gammaproteobacteria bacterium]